MDQKHYHNDYKKLHGVDESRTASEKLLDRNLTKRRQAEGLNLAEVRQSEPQKKVKKESHAGENIDAGDVIKKVIKAIKNQTQIKKVSKGLGVLRKCLISKQFMQQIGQNLLNELIETLFGVDTSVLGSPMDLMGISTETVEILSLIKQAQITQKVETKIRLKILYLNLMNDDSFSFNKSLIELKEMVFQSFRVLKDQKQNQAQSSEPVKQQDALERDESIVLFCENQILRKMFKLPNLGTDWVRNSVVSFLKEFMIEFKDLLAEQRPFLVEYNKLCNKKSTGVSLESYDFMGSKSANNGGAFTIVENQDATGSWCQRQ